MKKTLKHVFVSFFLIFVIILCCGCDILTGDDYYKKTGWNVSEEQFTKEYYTLYKNKLNSLKQKYELNYVEKEDFIIKPSDYQQHQLYLYTESYTFRFRLTNCHDLAYYEGWLYYYGLNGDFGQYEDYKNLIYFLNDFTNFAAYDAKTDGCHFEELYYEAKKNYLDLYASEEIHFDNTIGSVKYFVSVQPRKAGYYYMALEDSSINRYAFEFRFKGLLKPLI